MSDESTLRLRAAGFLISVLGGFLVALGSLMPWAEVLFGGTSTVVGIDIGDGVITLVAGLAVIIAVLAMRVGKTMRARRGLAVVVIAGGVVAISIGIGVVSNAEEKFGLPVVQEKLEMISEQTGLPLEELIKQRNIPLEQVSLQAGVFVVIGGGVIGLIGGALSMMWAARWKGWKQVEEDDEGAASGEDPPG